MHFCSPCEKSFSTLFASAFLLVLAGCGNQPNGFHNNRTKEILVAGKYDAEAIGTAAPKETSRESPTLPDDSVVNDKRTDPTDETLTVDRSVDQASDAITVKSFSVLRSSIAACFSSTKFTLVRADMILSSGSENPAKLEGGRVRFLLPVDGIESGIDILDYEGKHLGATDDTSRTTVSSSALSDTYLRALGTVADVVAHSCELDDPFCSCSDEGDARAMMMRCLPQLNPQDEQFSLVAKAMAAECSSGPEGQRRAISGMISSYAFAQGR